jgi:hypothetical protein
VVNIIRECHVPHHGPCDAVLSEANVIATVEAHGMKVRVSNRGVITAWESSTTLPFDGGPAYDSSTWVPVPTGVHALADWLGY